MTRILSAEQKQEMAQLYREGKSTNTLGKRYGVHRDTIRYSLKSMGVVMRGANEGERARRYVCDDHFFDVINSEEKAYWLGFFAADGSVVGRDIKLYLSSKDREHIARFRHALGSDHPIADRTRNHTHPVNGHVIGIAHSSCLTINSIYLVRALESHNITSDKSLSLRWPTTMPDTLIRHFVRGYIDGDGSWWTSSGQLALSILGSPYFLIECQRHLMEHCGLSPNKIGQYQASGKIYKVKYGGNRQLKRVALYLYFNASIYLDRKYQVVRPFL